MKRLVLLIIAIPLLIHAQEGWEKIYGGKDYDYGYWGEQTEDGGYIVVGSTSSFGSGFGDIWLLKLDEHGDTIWTKTYGEPYSTEEGKCIRQTSDGGYIIAGVWDVAISYNALWLVKIDSLGDTLWTKIYGGAQAHDEIHYVETTSDGGYLIAGQLSMPSPTGYVCLIKTDSLGDSQWSRYYDIQARCVKETSDGGYIVVGSRWNSGPRSYDFCIAKTDENGDSLWSRAYGGSGEDDEGYSIVETEDGNYLAVGYTETDSEGGRDLWLLKLDTDGDTLWTKKYGGEWRDEGYSIQPTSGRCYIISGSESSIGPGDLNIWLLKINKDGDTLWTRIYGEDYADYGYCVDQTFDGGYFITASSFRIFGSGWMYNAWVIKLDSLGLGLIPKLKPIRSIKPDYGERVYEMKPTARFQNQSNEYSKMFVGHADIRSLPDSTIIYSDGYYVVQESLSPWSTIDIEFDKWTAPDSSDYEVIYYLTSTHYDTLITDTLVVGFYWGAIAEQPPVTHWQIASSVGRQIVLRYANSPEGFHANIFNASGRKVDEVRGSAASGTITWGEGYGCYGPGVYFIRDVSDHPVTHKVVLVK